MAHVSALYPCPCSETCLGTSPATCLPHSSFSFGNADMGYIRLATGKSCLTPVQLICHQVAVPVSGWDQAFSNLVKSESALPTVFHDLRVP